MEGERERRKDQEEALEWILRNQLGRRNLTDFQRNRIALKYESVISERMKGRQATSTGGKNPQLLTKWSEAEKKKKTTTRKELAKIAGTAQGSIQRTKLILNKGTSEQIKRAEKGGKGNSVSAIAIIVLGWEYTAHPPRSRNKAKNYNVEKGRGIHE